MINSLNHFSVRTNSLNKTRFFYEDILGLQVGPRPSFPFPGLWLYLGDISSPRNAVVHVISSEGSQEGLEAYLGSRVVGEDGSKGALDHVAFFALNKHDFIKRFEKHGVHYRERIIPDLQLHQLFVDDPNGIVIELNFPSGD